MPRLMKQDAEEKLERTRLALDTMKDLFHDLSREKAAPLLIARRQQERLSLPGCPVEVEVFRPLMVCLFTSG